MIAERCVSVAVVTYFSRQSIGACLDSLRDTARDWILDCVVVDNGSGDGTAAEVRARRDDWVQIIESRENVGYGRAVNQAAQNLRAEFLLILNPDTIVRPGAIAEMVRFLRYRKEAAACGPKIVDVQGKAQHVARRGFPTLGNTLGYFLRLDRLLPHHPVLGGYYRRGVPLDYEVLTDALSGSSMMVRRCAFDAVGGFDEDYFLYGEDIDLCWKLRQAGHEIWYVPSAVVMHLKGASMRQARKLARREYYRSMRVFIGKRLSGRYSRFALWWMKAGVTVASVVSRRP